ncbi:uncharacterized protein DUF4307 [Microbacteriaceae bacterium MWH-Ta3]|nr:uncharacterized protein DUF4307 [Microbacteriaceae bacterium MWH-Ta3]
MTETPDSRESVLQARYGRTRSPLSRRTLVLWAAGLITAFIAFAVWSISLTPGTGIEFRDRSMTIAGNSVELTYTVSAPAGTTVACAVRALGDGFTEIGWIVQKHPAQESTTTTYVVDIRATSEPVAAGVDHCWRY